MSTPPARRRRGAAIVVALLFAVGAPLLTLPDREEGPRCEGRRVASWSVDARMTKAFAQYGDDNTRLDDWTGGDGTHSVRLPDGRTLWLFSDTFLDRVRQPPNLLGMPHRWRTTDTGSAPALIRNSAVVMDRRGRVERTLPPGTAGPFFPDEAGAWRWPVRARVEPRAPGSAERVVRVLLWKRTPGQGPWVFGVPRATEVATLSLPSLRLETIDPVLDQSTVPDVGRRVLYGAAAVDDGGWTYVYGGDDGPGEPASRAYLARVPEGSLNDRSAWRYWGGNGSGSGGGGGWRTDASEAEPVLKDGGRRGVGSSFTVVRDQGAYVLFTMDVAGPGASGLSAMTSYWSCSPEGPWHGPNGRIELPRPENSPGGGDQHVAAYNPQAHPEFTEGRSGGPGEGDEAAEAGTAGGPGDAGDGLLLSYDVNWFAAPGVPSDGRLNNNVELYRPRFLRVRTGPVPEP